jgi:hypothetical protein
MIIADEAAGNVEKELDMHALGKLWALIYRSRVLPVKSVVVGKSCRKWRTCAVEAGKQSIGERGARCFAYETRLRRPLMDWPVLLLVKQRIKQITLL